MVSRFGRGDDTVGNPHRAHISQFELFELILLLKSDKQSPVEQIEASRAIRGSSISVSSTLPPLRNGCKPQLQTYCTNKFPHTHTQTTTINKHNPQEYTQPTIYTAHKNTHTHKQQQLVNTTHKHKQPQYT